MSSMSFTDGNGRPIKDFGAHLMKAAQKELQKHLVAETRARTAHLKCPTHNQNISNIAVKPAGQNMTISFECCCAELEKLAEQAIQAA